MQRRSVLLAAVLAGLLVGAAWFGVRAASGLRSPAGAAPRAASPAPSAPAGAELPAYRHVFLVLIENHGYRSVVGSRSAPYLNGTLIAHGAVAANYHAIAHPSLPNYVAMQSGQTAGITTDCSPGPGCTANAPNLADRLEAAGRTWKAYEESMPVIVTWDEAEDAQAGNQVAAIFDGPGVAAGSVWRGDANHYSLLRTIEALEGVAPLTQADGGAAVMSGMFAGPGHA